MGKTYDAIDDKLAAFLLRQHLFFVATAPKIGHGHVNLSPKGLDGFRVLSPTSVAYLDYPGSGVETIAHLRDDGRITLLFCAFSGAPKLVRIYGHGRALEPGDPDYDRLLPTFHVLMPPRAIIVIDVERVADSCGYGVPRYEYLGERDQLLDWAERKGEDGIERYQRDKNATSIDGLPGLRRFKP